ncbi:MAG: class I SAM-dependent methyltransferase [Balneolaceae bacterium]
MSDCLLCGQSGANTTLRENDYTYLKCANCGLYFVKPGERLSIEEEKRRYDFHENHPEDPKYRNFLSQLFDPVQKKLQRNKSGLDYGSGPGPTLHIMFEEAGHKMAHYDPIYNSDTSVFNQTYDFITVSETAEHFYSPGEEFDKLWGLLRPNGILGVMTKLLTHPDHFDTWHYRKDDTHVAFYQPQTFEWIAHKYNADLEFYGDRVILLIKKNNMNSSNKSL